MNIRTKIGSRISTSRKNLGLTLKDLSEKTGKFSSARLSNWESGARSPGPMEAMVLSKTLGVAPSYILCLSDDPNGDLLLKNDVLPHYVPIIALCDAKQVTDNFAETCNQMNKSLYDDKKLALLPEIAASVSSRAYAVTLTDNSMEPKFSAGDHVIVDPETRPLPGQYVLVHFIKRKTIEFRKLRELGNGDNHSLCYEFVPNNSDWPPSQATKSDAEIIATAVEHRHYL